MILKVKDRGTIWATYPMRYIIESQTEDEAHVLENIAAFFPKGRQSDGNHHDLELVETVQDDDEVRLVFHAWPQMILP